MSRGIKIRIQDTGGQRIDKYLSDQLNDLTRSHIQKLLKEHSVLVNGKPVKANYKLIPEDLIELTIPELKEPDILPENIPLEILYEDQDIIIVNKPKGMVVHPAAGHYSGTLVNALMYHCKDNLSGINGVMRPGIVHRIDKDTTGSILVCKNDLSHQRMAAQFKEHSMNRVYHAIVWGNLKEDRGTIHAPIGRHPVDRKKMSINHKNGKDAVTHYTVLKRYRKYTYVACSLETGRTHQIRVHMASLGHPLLGDTTYGFSKQPYLTNGQVLHAKTLGIVHPITWQPLTVEAPLPEYFTNLLSCLDAQSP